MERAVGLIDGIIQDDAFKTMLDDFAAVRDHPEPGATTCVIYGEKSDLPVPPGMLRTECRIGNAIVRPNDDGTCRLTMFACMNFHFPSFVWNAMSSGWMIRNVIKMETYYQKQCAQ